MFFSKPPADLPPDPERERREAAFRDRYKAVLYRPVSKRRRLLIVLLALATAAVVLLQILGRRDAIHSHPLLLPLPADVSACKDGKTTGCVGGMATVIVTPAPALAADPAPSPALAPAASTPPAPRRPAPG
jgi:hypothetical protein